MSLDVDKCIRTDATTAYRVHHLTIQVVVRLENSRTVDYQLPLRRLRYKLPRLRWIPTNQKSPNLRARSRNCSCTLDVACYSPVAVVGISIVIATMKLKGD